MTPEIFCLCEGATIKEGQLCILHTLANAFATEYPAEFMAVIVYQLRFMQDEDGEHLVSLELRHADGEIVWKAVPQILTSNTTGRNCSIIAQSIPMVATLLRGQHELSLNVDGREVSTLLLYGALIAPAK